MNHYLVQSISQLENSRFLVALGEKTKFKPRRTRRERWSSSDDWYPGDEPQIPFGRQAFEPTGFSIPMDAKTFGELGLFVGAEVELLLKITSDFAR